MNSAVGCYDKQPTDGGRWVASQEFILLECSYAANARQFS